VATWLASEYGVQTVGYYLSAAGLITILALLAVRRHASVK
jgi:hypothetical protein